MLLLSLKLGNTITQETTSISLPRILLPYPLMVQLVGNFASIGDHFDDSTDILPYAQESQHVHQSREGTCSTMAHIPHGWWLAHDP